MLNGRVIGKQCVGNKIAPSSIEEIVAIVFKPLSYVPCFDLTLIFLVQMGGAVQRGDDFVVQRDLILGLHKLAVE